MKNAITITSTAIALIAVTITTPSTPPRTAITVDDELFSPSPSPSDERKGYRCVRDAICALTTSCRVSEGGEGAPSRVEDCDNDVITSSTPQAQNCVEILVSWESSASSSLSIVDSSSSCRVCQLPAHL